MIPNFARVDGEIFRGGQPSGQDWMFLQSLSINRVIKLNEDCEAIDEPPAGMELFKCPISLTQQILTEPDLERLKDALDFIDTGTFIHCEHGQDRTGLLVGMYRVLMQDWTKEEAYQEMLARGFHPLLAGLDKAWQDL